MNAKLCDRCRKPIVGVLAAEELCLGDGKAYAIRIAINEINGKGFRHGDFHDRCLVEFVAELIGLLAETLS